MPLEFDEIEWQEYVNVPRTIARVVSSKLATLRDLDEHYSTQDLWDFMEIITIDNTNQRLANKPKD